jgi:leucyl-tRNA synthetase
MKLHYIKTLNMAKESYNHQEIEKAAQKKWASLDLYNTDLFDTEKEPYYLLVEFPYPSGDLHTGHWYAYAMPDIYARYLRMNGKNVLFPFGFDAFGLPAENAAIKRGLDPKEWTYSNMESMRAQIKGMGASFDWSKEVVTCDPAYYRWTQWLFSKLYDHKLAERREAAVKWCPKDLTVLANEQVNNGHCERCGTAVEEKILTQWFLKITQYAKRLLDDLDPLPWRSEIKEAQRAWIGESEGAKIFFNVRSIANDDAGVIEVFTTRPDTIFGATYVVLAPDHVLTETLLRLVTNKDKVEEYRLATTRKTERERSENKEKTGVQLEGLMAVNPATNQEIPIFLADYVLGSYGTGAVMAVPAHDERDFEFAQKYDLSVRQVVAPRFTQTTEPGAFQENEPVVVKDGVIAIVKHWKEDKYIGLKWKKVAWGTLLTGGVDDGMTPEATVLKEIQEETGYLNPKIEQNLGIVEGLFYHVPKQTNKLVRGHMFYVELQNDACEIVSEVEEGLHEIKWLTLAELRKFLTADTHQYALKVFADGIKPYVESGFLTNSDKFDGRQNEEAMGEIVEAVGGELVTQYRLRDWLVSRQRYWGCPIPVVYDPEGQPHLVPAEHLPWTLPTDVDFTPSEKSPLATSKELHERVERIFGKGWTPEYDTLDTFVDSSWYYLRYLDHTDEHDFSDQKLMKRWTPVDRYSGGSEHTTMHLLYARFFHKALHDLDLVPAAEPFTERLNRGIILGPDGQKMSKSKGNVINPDELVQKFGADAVRMYLAFIGPYNEPGSYPWNLDGVESMRKFLDRIYRLSTRLNDEELSADFVKALGKASAKVGSDIERFKFNTAISALMILVRDLEAFPEIPRIAYGQLLTLLAPFAPHLAEHLWIATEAQMATARNSDSNHDQAQSIHQNAWPDLYLEEESTVTVTVQVNSKKKGLIQIAKDASEEEALAEAMQIPFISELYSGSTAARVVYVPGKILNLVIPS